MAVWGCGQAQGIGRPVGVDAQLLLHASAALLVQCHGRRRAALAALRGPRLTSRVARRPRRMSNNLAPDQFGPAIAFREYSFLDNPQAAELKQSAMALEVCPVGGGRGCRLGADPCGAAGARGGATLLACGCCGAAC